MPLDDFGAAAPSGYTPKRGRSDIQAARDNQAEEERDRLAPTQWALMRAGTYVATPRTYDRLAPGFYEIGYLNEQSVFIQKDVQVDELISFADSVPANVVAEIASFWDKFARFQKYNYLHRRGYLLYGPPGCGKTAMAQQVIADIIKDNGIVFMCQQPNIFVLGLDKFRQVEPERPIVCVFEDSDSMIEEYGEDSILALLDGENQVNRVLNIATTNYPEKLNKRIVGRPRRFDRVIRIGPPTEAVRREYFRRKAQLEGAELETWVKETELLSFASLAELVISVKCLDNDFTATIEILKDMNSSKPPSSHEDDVEQAGGVGFAVKQR